MQVDVNKIIEMALDFGEFGVKDPHDPEFHQTLTGERVVVYYGTTNNHFWEVVRHGIAAGPTVRRSHPNYNDLSFDQAEARDNARRKAYKENNEESEGPAQPLVFTLETTIQKPYKGGGGEMEQFVAGTSIGAETNTLLPLTIKPNAITGVLYGEMNNTWETPVKKFIQQVNYGNIEGIEPDPTFKRSTYRPYGPTKEGWQLAVLRYVNDLLNYSSNYFQYLVSDEVPKPYNDTIIREATKLGLGKMMSWRGNDFMEWIYKILPIPIDDTETSKEDDINQVMQQAEYSGWNRPFYQVMDKYKDDTSYEYRSGKKTNESNSRGLPPPVEERLRVIREMLNDSCEQLRSLLPHSELELRDEAVEQLGPALDMITSINLNYRIQDFPQLEWVGTALKSCEESLTDLLNSDDWAKAEDASIVQQVVDILDDLLK